MNAVARDKRDSLRASLRRNIQSLRRLQCFRSTSSTIKERPTMDDSIFSSSMAQVNPSTPIRKKGHKGQEELYSPTSTAFMMYSSSDYDMTGPPPYFSSIYSMNPRRISIPQPRTINDSQDQEDDENLLGLDLLPEE
mmetsp:Transcript_31619/g.47784  ORF Transcript_31619/g.47784 Transcript_31619/m.47784 type:complete len:137 (+) Transcript_31619:155-565(+)